MSSRDDRREDDIAARLDELEAALDALRSELQTTETTAPPRPPRLTELVRFTEQYTIPTLIALLETTITSLELLRGALRLVDPDSRVNDRNDVSDGRLTEVRDGAADGLVRSLSELQRALSATDLPDDATSRSILEDVRELSAEIETRVKEGQRTADDASERTRSSRRPARRQRSPPDDAVHIDVTDPTTDTAGETATDDGSRAEDEHRSEEPAVDVESELESIKQQVDDDARESAATTKTRDQSADEGGDGRDGGSDDDGSDSNDRDGRDGDGGSGSDGRDDSNDDNTQTP